MRNERVRCKIFRQFRACERTYDWPALPHQRKPAQAALLAGTVLVAGGVATAVAGRSMYLDGGVRLCRLDVESGRSRSVDEKIELTTEFRNRMGPRLAEGRLQAVVDRTFPLEDAAEAHATMERNANFGKIVLTLGEA